MRERDTDWLLSHAPNGAWPETEACTLTYNGTSDLLVHRLVAQSNEPHQLGL